jgi:dolichol kinase
MAAMADRPAPVSAPQRTSGDADAFPFVAELKRKALHILALVVPLGMAWLGLPDALYVLIPASALALTGDVLRAFSPGFNRFIRRVFGSMMRRRELPPAGQGIVINGATWVLVSATLLALVFPLRAVIPVFTMFMVSDAVAAVVGRRWGRHAWGRTPRTVEGSAAFLVTGLGVIACFSTPPLSVGAVAVGSACVAEALPGPGNDNMRVPFTGTLTLVVVEWLLFARPVHLFPAF